MTISPPTAFTTSIPVVDFYLQNSAELVTNSLGKATYAYHLSFQDLNHPLSSVMHVFPNGEGVKKFQSGELDESGIPVPFPEESKSDTCLICGRSRENVRHDDLPAYCVPRFDKINSNKLNIESTVSSEEEKCQNLIQKGTREIPHLFEKYGSDGQALAILKHTHGYDLEVTMSVLGKTPSEVSHLLVDYELAMDAESSLSKSRLKKEIITAR